MIARYAFWSVVALCTTFLIYRAGAAISASAGADEKERKRYDSQLLRESRRDIGDAEPIRLIEADDGLRLVVIGDYRKDTFVIMQRFADGYRVVYPAKGADVGSARAAILKLEAMP